MLTTLSTFVQQSRIRLSIPGKPARARPMKILIVNDYGTLGGGAEHISLALRDGLRQRGHEARLFASTARHPGLHNVADDVCFGSESAARRLLQVANPWAMRQLGSVLSRFRPDVVHVRMFLTQLSPLILPLLYRQRSLLHVVNYQTICPINTKVLADGSACHHRAGMACYREGCVSLAGVARASVQLGLARRWRDAFDLIVANSDWTRRRLRAEGIDVTETIWNGVPVHPPRPPVAWPPTIAYAGRLVAKKGVGILVRAMTNIVGHLPDVRLLIVGEGPDRSDLERLVGVLELGEHVSFTGHHPRAEMEALLARAWVQAVPSLWEEPFGLVAAEAMMRGTAVVATCTGGLSEQVRSGETGLLVPGGDVDALAAALLRILKDRSLAEDMGARGRDVALSEFRQELVVDRFEQLYTRLVLTRIAEG